MKLLTVLYINGIYCLVNLDKNQSVLSLIVIGLSLGLFSSNIPAKKVIQLAILKLENRCDRQRRRVVLDIIGWNQTFLLQ
jgi:hypothetical protein